MVVVMKERASDTQVEKVIAHLVELGMDVHRSSGASRTVLGVVGSGKVDPRLIELLEGVHEVIRMPAPCPAETEAQVHTTAAAVKREGAKVLRGGAFKPRSSPYSFQGL